MNATIRAAALAFAMVAGVAACSNDQQAPSSPTPSIPSAPPVPSVTSLALTGKTSSVGVHEFDGAWLGMVPGETARLIATATFSDNTERDVTAETTWHCDPLEVVSIVSPGVIRAQSSGWAVVAAKYGSVTSSNGPDRAEARLRVAPDGVFLLGVLVDDGRGATADARVQVTSAAGAFSATTPYWGGVFLPALGSTILQVEKAGYVTIRKSVIVSQDEELLYTLQRSGTALSAAHLPMGFARIPYFFSTSFTASAR